MDFSDAISALAQRIDKQKDVIETEEATKNAFVMPFLNALGYDVFNPHIVVPEFTADVGVKKGEKVDYAIKLDDKVVMLVECKPCKISLSTSHMSQLYRYFSVTESRFAILTNGIVHWFFTDLDQSNIMDSKPFFEFDMLNYRPAQVDELKKFAIGNFDVASILETASDLKYGSLLMRQIAGEIDSPSDELIRMLIGRIHEGRMAPGIVAKFTPLVRRAMKDTVRELLNQRLFSALDEPGKATAPISAPDETPPPCDEDSDDIVTTQDEIDGYQIVRAIVREVVTAGRIAMRDARSYCAILLDNNNRKPICRLHFNRSTKYIGLFDENKAEEKVRIDSLDDIFMHADRLKRTVAAYDPSKIGGPSPA